MKNPEKIFDYYIIMFNQTRTVEQTTVKKLTGFETVFAILCLLVGITLKIKK